MSVEIIKKEKIEERLARHEKILNDIKSEIFDFKKSLLLFMILNKKILTIDEASLYTGYSKKYLYKLNSTDSDLPTYSTNPNGKVYFKREELEIWMTKHSKNNYVELQNSLDNYLMRA